MNKAINAFQKDAEAFEQYALEEVRIAGMRGRLLVVEMEHIYKCLKNKMIDADTAMAWLADAKALDFLRPIVPDNSEADAKAGEV